MFTTNLGLAAALGHILYYNWGTNLSIGKRNVPNGMVFSCNSNPDEQKEWQFLLLSQN